MEVNDVIRINYLQDEKTMLKRIIAKLSLKSYAVKTVLEKKYGIRTVK